MSANLTGKRPRLANDLSRFVSEVEVETKLIQWEIKKFSSLPMVKDFPRSDFLINFAPSKKFAQRTKWSANLSVDQDYFGLHVTVKLSPEPSDDMIMCKLNISIKTLGGKVFYENAVEQLINFAIRGMRVRHFGVNQISTFKELLNPLSSVLRDDTLTIQLKLDIYTVETKEKPAGAE